MIAKALGFIARELRRQTKLHMAHLTLAAASAPPVLRREIEGLLTDTIAQCDGDLPP